MLISELIQSKTVLFDLKAKELDGVIDELATALVANGNVVNKEAFVAEIKAREEMSSTAFGGGIAIPHAKCDAVLKPAICFGKSVTGAEYNAMDGEVVHLFFMIAAPASGGDLHLKTLAKLARKLVHDEFKERLLQASNEDALMNILKEIDE